MDVFSQRVDYRRRVAWRHRQHIVLPWRHPGSPLSTVVYLITRPSASRFITVQLLDRCCSLSASVSCVKKKSFLTKHPEQRDSRDVAAQTFKKKKSKRTSCDLVCHPSAAARTVREVAKCITSDVSKAFFAVLAIVDRVVIAPPPPPNPLPALEEEVPGI